MCIEAWVKAENRRHDSNAWMMYHGALLGHIKYNKLPPLSDFLATKKAPVKKESEASIMAMVRAYQNQRDRHAGRKPSR